MESSGRELFAGMCHGGPLDGRTITVRFPKGFIACATSAFDRQAESKTRTVWIYDRVENGDFYVKTDVGAPFDEEKYESARDGSDNDVVAI